jgi:hypothetical protein
VPVSSTPTKVETAAVPKNQAKCAFFPSCTRAECPFFHPTELCKFVFLFSRIDR